MADDQLDVSQEKVTGADLTDVTAWLCLKKGSDPLEGIQNP